MDDSINTVFAILRELAKEKRLISYDDLTRKADITDDVLFIALRKIAHVCEAKNYPPITALVVKHNVLAPGNDFWMNQDSRRISNKDGWWAEKIREVYLFCWENVKSDLRGLSMKRIRTL